MSDEPKHVHVIPGGTGDPAPGSDDGGGPGSGAITFLPGSEEPRRSASPSQREIVVFPPSDMRKGEGIVLKFESGEEVKLVPGLGGSFRGSLVRARIEDPFSIHRTPGNVPEVGFHGQHVPRRSAAMIDEPMWVYPVAWRDRLPRGTFPTRSGLHQDLVIRTSDRVPGARVLRVHLPDAYLREPTRRFPVVYVLDGQNAFDASTSYGGIEWGLDDIATQIEIEGGTPCILVGIDNGAERRMFEYSFCPAPKAPKKPASTGSEATAPSGDWTKLADAAAPSGGGTAAAPEPTGGAAVAAAAAVEQADASRSEEDGGGALQHLEFLLYEVAPLIRSRFRAQDGPGSLIGSSMGGLFGLWAAIAHPGAFRSVAVVSPSVWWARQAVLRIPPGDGPRPRVWIDMGTRESKTMVNQFQSACERLQALGWREGRDLRSLLIKGATHHESSWADRSSSILRFLLAEG